MTEKIELIYERRTRGNKWVKRVAIFSSAMALNEWFKMPIGEIRIISRKIVDKVV
jgi:hypothetical protein